VITSDYLPFEHGLIDGLHIYFRRLLVFVGVLLLASAFMGTALAYFHFSASHVESSVRPFHGSLLGRATAFAFATVPAVLFVYLTYLKIKFGVSFRYIFSVTKAVSTMAIVVGVAGIILSRWVAEPDWLLLIGMMSLSWIAVLISLRALLRKVKELETVLPKRGNVETR
jgi:hypothetical protein